MWSPKNIPRHIGTYMQIQTEASFPCAIPWNLLTFYQKLQKYIVAYI